MKNKPIIIWTWISIIMTFFLGAMFYLNPSKVFPPATTTAEMARFVGIKNVVYSFLMLYALLKKSKSMLVVLLLGRGIQDMADGITGISMGYLIVPYFSALISGIITAIAGYVLAKTKETPHQVS